MHKISIKYLLLFSNKRLKFVMSAAPKKKKTRFAKMPSKLIAPQCDCFLLVVSVNSSKFIIVLRETSLKG